MRYHFNNEVMTRYIHKGLQPKYKKVSRTTLRHDALKGYYKEKKELIRFFKHFDGKISLTSDVWSAEHNLNLSYLCITCHWIDNITWELSKRIICFEIFENPRTSNAIYQTIMTCLIEYKIKDKIFSISFDNSSNNNFVVSKLQRDLNPILGGVFFHNRCVCHVLNLVVKKELTNVRPVVDKIKDLLTLIYH